MKQYNTLLTDLIDLESTLVDDQFDYDSLMGSRFDDSYTTTKHSRKGLTLVKTETNERKAYIPWDQITLSKERINEIVLEVIAEFNANNKVK